MKIQTTTQFKRTLKQYKKKHYSIKLVNQATDALTNRLCIGSKTISCLLANVPCTWADTPAIG